MIKLIILDVDGVILGTKKGHNSPFPSPAVTKYLKELQDQGVLISLCTGKASFATRIMVESMQLNNLHISDGGAVVFDPIDNEILKSIMLPKEPMIELLKETKDKHTLWELYTLENWYVRSDSDKKYAKQHQENSNIVPWLELDDLVPLVQNTLLTKAMILYLPETEAYYQELMGRYEDVINLQWTSTPALIPNKLLIITAKGINKRTVVSDLISHYKLTPDEVLAVGDTMMDWKFMEGCGYLGVMGNANAEMQKMIRGKGGFVGGHVDADGIIDILEHFKSQIVFSK